MKLEDELKYKPWLLFQTQMRQVDSTHPGMGRTDSTNNRSQRNRDTERNKVPKVTFTLKTGKLKREYFTCSLGENLICPPRIYSPAFFQKLGGGGAYKTGCMNYYIFSVISPGKHAKGKPIISADLVVDVREFIIDMTTIMDSDHWIGKAWADMPQSTVDFL
jgi:hypothetical protein